MAKNYTVKSRNDDTTGKLIAGAAGFGLGLLASPARKAAVQAVTAMAGDWFEGLKAEHKLTMKLFDAIEATTDEDTTKRATLLLQLQHALGKHAVEEENVIYCTVRALGDVTDADALSHDHAYVKQNLYDLEKLDKGSPAWLPKVQKFRAEVETHVRKEEDEVFPALMAKLTTEESRQLTGRMNREGFKVA